VPDQTPKVGKIDGAALGIALGTRMIVEPAGMGDRFRTEFIGMSRGQYLIVRIPRVPGINDYLYVEKTVTVRYVHEGNVYGLQSEVLWTLNAPYKLLFLRYPDTVEMLNLRKCQRVDCYLPVQVGVSEDEQFTQYEGMILNLSCGGCQVVIDTKGGGQLPPITVDSMVNLEFRMIGSDKLTKLDGKAKNLNVNENRLYFGVMYDDLPIDVRNGIDEYIESVAEYLAD